MSPGSGGDPLTVPVRRLDEALSEWEIESVDLMKIDVEGHELHVLRGGADSLASGRIKVVLCEFNDHWLTRQGSSAHELYDHFRELGFDDGASPPALGPESFETRLLVHHAAGSKIGKS
jgi:hypothetical protein